MLVFPADVLTTRWISPIDFREHVEREDRFLDPEVWDQAPDEVQIAQLLPQPAG